MKSARSLKGWIMSVVLAFSFLFLFASLAGAIDYTYDDLNRLLRVEYDDGTVIEYVYDEVGNRVQRVSGISLPGQPTGLVASTVSADQINLTWTDNADDETGFMVERKIGAGGTYAAP
ncbi:MAG: RHS repeat protein [Desulfovibrionales bacterium]|nr:RHS repeat protein [Desulfovibrionales bacterium]